MILWLQKGSYAPDEQHNLKKVGKPRNDKKKDFGELKNLH